MTASGPDAHAGRLGRARAALAAFGDFLLKQRHLAALRDGVVGALPLILVGSLFLLLAQPPSRALQALVAPYVPLLLVPYRALGGMVAVYVTFCAAHSLAKSHQLDAMACGLVAMASYVVAALPTPDLAVPGGAAVAAPALLWPRLGASGIFAGLLLALGSVELTRVFVTQRWTIRLPPSAPEVVVRSFLALVPALAVIVLTFLVVHVLRVDLVLLLDRAARPFLVATGSLPAAIAVVAVDSTLWLLGVHASAALSTLKPLWEAMLVQNMEAVSHGQTVLPHIATQQFYVWFVWQGGSGMTLPLALHLLRARSGQLRSLGRLSLLPALCNINEPILFGVPVVLNPKLAVPFFLAPIGSAVLAYAALAAGWVTRPYLETVWTLPAPLGAFLSTGGDVRAIVLELCTLGWGLALYWPFVRRYDASLVAKEAGGGQALSPAPPAS